MFRGYKKMMPREKMLKFGSSRLDEKELIAILLRTGSKDLSVIDLAEKTLKDNNYSLCKLHNLPLEELRKTKGMGEVKALTIKAALELGQRYHHEKLKQKNKISHPSDIYSICRDMEFLDQEVVRVICLDSKTTVIAVEDVTKGINNASLIHPREVFRSAILTSSASIALVHNHPSGDPFPSIQDNETTEKIRDSGDLLGIKLIDHVIIGKGSFYSFTLGKSLKWEENQNGKESGSRKIAET